MATLNVFANNEPMLENKKTKTKPFNCLELKLKVMIFTITH